MQALAAGVRVSCLLNVILHVKNIIIPARNLICGAATHPGAISNSLVRNADRLITERKAAFGAANMLPL